MNLDLWPFLSRANTIGDARCISRRHATNSFVWTMLWYSDEDFSKIELSVWISYKYGPTMYGNSKTVSVFLNGTTGHVYSATLGFPEELKTVAGIMAALDYSDEQLSNLLRPLL